MIRRSVIRRGLALGTRAAAACLAALLATAPAARGAPRLEVRAVEYGARRLEPLFGEALRAPGDSARLARAVARAGVRLEDEGYLDARVDAAWSPPAPGAEPVLRVAVAEGPRVRYATVGIEAGSAEESAALAALLELRVGDPASPQELGRALTRAARRLADDGYPYAELAIQGFEWDSAGARVRVTGSRGPRVTVVGVRTDGLHVTRPALVNRVIGRAVGRPFHPAAAEAARERLVQLGLFRSVSYEGLEGEGDWARGRLVYRVEEPRYNRFEGAIGRQSEGRATGLANLELGNLAGTGRTLAGRWESRGSNRELFAARYVEPWLLGLPLRAELLLDQQREDTLYTRARAGLRLHFLVSGHERLEAGVDQDRVLQPHAEAEEAQVQSTVFALEHDGRDLPAAPRNGTRARLSASTSFKRETVAGGGRRKSRASAVEAMFEWHRPLAGGFGLAWEVSGAARFSSQPVLALYERYVLGGAASLRGYDEQEFRADRYGLSRLEARWFPGRTAQHLALFWDHAWMVSRLAIANDTRLEERRRDGVGFGLRFDSPAGRIGVDYGLAPGRPPAEGKLHLQLVSSF